MNGEQGERQRSGEGAPGAPNAAPAHTHTRNGAKQHAKWSGVDLPEGVIAMRVPERLVNTDSPENEHATAVGVYAFAARFHAPSNNGKH